MAFLTLGLTLSKAVDARQRMAKTPYGQARQAVDSISELVAQMSEDIDARLVNGEEGPVLDCLQSHRTATITLRDLADAERARLVEGAQRPAHLDHGHVALAPRPARRADAAVVPVEVAAALALGGRDAEPPVRPRGAGTAASALGPSAPNTSGRSQPAA